MIDQSGTLEPIDEPTQYKFRLDKRYTVLSLDGGGVRGLLTVNVLATMEQMIEDKIKRPFKITDAFDCVIGSSAGGFIALLLAAGHSARELRDSVFECFFKHMFEISNSKLTWWWKPLYIDEYFEKEIRDHIYGKMGWKEGDPEKTMADLRKVNPKLRTCITALKYEYNEKTGPIFTPRIFDTSNPKDDHKTLVQITRAAGSVPACYTPS
jgi:patatin-like phospholipase/acyl hydrolase